MSKRILITGGAGFIGFHLARHLLAKRKNIKITLVDNLSRGRMDVDFRTLLKDRRVRFFKMDLTNPSFFANLGGGYAEVYHLAAVNGTRNFYKMPHEVLRINTFSLANMLEWMRRRNLRGKFLFTSSNEAYAGTLESFGRLTLPTPESVPLVVSNTYNPRWSYAATKLLGELYVIHYAKNYGFRAVVVRPHNFYGPRAGFDHIIPEMSLRIAKNKRPLVIYNPRHTRSYCHIDDAVRAMAMLMDSKKTDKQPIETVHIGTGEEISNKDLVYKLCDAAGFSPKKTTFKHGKEGDVIRRCPDISKIKKLIGWKPEITLEQGLKKTYDWYSSQANEA